MTTLIALPRRTSHTYSGPILHVSGTNATLRYDTEEEGETSWTELAFSDVLRIEYTSGAACGEGDVIGSDYIVAETSSPDIDVLEDRWSASVGWHESAPRPQLTKYRIFFDDAAAIVVIARSVAINGEPSHSRS